MKLIIREDIQDQEYNNYINLLKKYIADDEKQQLAGLRKLLSSPNSRDFNKSELRNDIEAFARIVDKSKGHDEFDYDFAANVKSIASIEGQDQKDFDSICGELIGTLNVIVLAGHEHQVKFSSTGKSKSPVFIASKLFTGNKVSYFLVNPNIKAADLYRVFCVNDNTTSYETSHFPP